MDQEGIKRKIQSLLALVGSNNEHKALAAMLASVLEKIFNGKHVTGIGRMAVSVF